MIGQTLSHYRILEKLGEGGMGVVYRARDTHLDRGVAIKILRPETVGDPERMWRFVREAKAASALNHPSIVTIHDIDTANGVDFIATEWVEGESLDRRIGGKGLPVEEALSYALQTAGALAVAQAAGIVHRDIKPANIMVAPAGRIKVLNSGLAKLIERGAAETPSRFSLPHGHRRTENPRGRHPRNAGLHVTRTGRRKARGYALRCLLFRLRPLTARRHHRRRRRWRGSVLPKGAGEER